MTELWHPIEGRTDIWDRAFRTEIEYPMNGVTTITGHIERCYDMGFKKVFEQFPSQCPNVSATTDEIMADPELLACMMLPVQEGITRLLYTLWTRKIAQSNEPSPVL